jgi:curved DNA-binding protein CbpA
MPHFYDCTTKEEARKRYLQLAKKMHPDRGGNPEEFKTMQAEYDRFDQPQYRFNRVKHPEYNESFINDFFGQSSQGFNPFRTYTENVKPNEFTYENYFKTQNEIERLKHQVNTLNRFMNDLENRNIELNKTLDHYQDYIVKLEEHWLIGRLLKWFKMCDY